MLSYNFGVPLGKIHSKRMINKRRHMRIKVERIKTDSRAQASGERSVARELYPQHEYSGKNMRHPRDVKWGKPERESRGEWELVDAFEVFVII